MGKSNLKSNMLKNALILIIFIGYIKECSNKKYLNKSIN